MSDGSCTQLEDVKFSKMYFEGRMNAATSLPYECPYPNNSEAEEDYLKGYQDYFKGRGGDAEGELALI